VRGATDRSPMRFLFSLAAVTAAFVAPAAAQDIVLVQHVTGVTVARAGGALVVTAAGTVPIAGFTSPVLKARPDLVKVEGVYVVDFVATAPPRGSAVAQVETRLAATLRIEADNAAAIRSIQVRGALGSRTVQVAK
jgi:hypothetical protein